ncbi:MAG TPA: UTP--glucose-1-phosphate uridylyltransferase GalU [Porticoccaceae bacterium]|nr:UTP--glucose-1-phosphate uridylyltransferase GalU [Porticoccaceae bacterium]
MLKKCLFPVAGYGTRFLPATKAMPKEMLPVVNKPLVQYGVEEALAAGLEEICFVTGRGKRAIHDHFDISYELEHQIAGSDKERYLVEIREIMQRGRFASTRQLEMKGLGHAILTGELLIGSQPFGVILADDLCFNDGPGVMAQLVEIYRRTGCTVIAIEEVADEEVSKFGIISGVEEGPGLYRVTDMVEKPQPGQAPSNLAIIGRYVLSPLIFELLRHTPPGKNGEIQLTDALCTLARTTKVLAYRFQGRRFDCGSVGGFVEATNHVYQNIYQRSDSPVGGK